MEILRSLALYISRVRLSYPILAWWTFRIFFIFFSARGGERGVRLSYPMLVCTLGSVCLRLGVRFRTAHQEKAGSQPLACYFGQDLQILEKEAFWHRHPARTSTKKLRSEKLRADFSFPTKGPFRTRNTQKNPRALKNKIGTPPPPTKTPPLKEEFYGHAFFPCRKNAFFQAPIKLAQPFPAPELQTKILRARGFF